MQQRTSKNTCINTLPATARLTPWNGYDRNLDLGAGRYNQLTDYLRALDISNAEYDPHWKTDAENRRALSREYHTVTCSNVINVIDCPEARRQLLALARRHLLPGGKLYATVYEGDRSGKGRQSKPDCWQENRRTADYVGELEAVFGRGNVSRKGRLLIAVRKA